MAEPSTTTTTTWIGSFAGIWQMPLLLLGLGMLTLSLAYARRAPEGPDFDGALASAESFLRTQQFEEAKAKINVVFDEIEQATETQKGKANLLRGDLIYLEQRLQGGDLEVNHLGVIDYYQKAEQVYQVKLDAQRLQRLAETNVALGRYDQAMRVLDRLREDNQPAEYRYSVVKRIIENRYAQNNAKPGDFAALLDRFAREIRDEKDDKKRRTEQIWLARFNGQRQLDINDANGAVDLILRRIYQLQAQSDGGSDDLAPLYVLLAKSYQMLGEFEDADLKYREAQEKLDRNDELNAEILVGRGQIQRATARSRSAFQTALQFFNQAAKDFPSSNALIEAMMGRADCAALLGAQSEALDDLESVVDQINDDRERWGRHVPQLESVVYSHFDLARDAGQYDLALDFLQVLKDLHGNQLPADLLVNLAVTEEAVGRQWHEKAQSKADRQANPEVIRAAQQLAYKNAWVHYANAGQYFFAHAQLVTVESNEQHGLSLWRAAENFDRAHQWNDAINAYKEFVRTRPSDPKNLLARRRIGGAFQADGQYEAAAKWYQQLIEEHPTASESYASLTPLAQCMVALGDYDAAERGLLTVLTNHPAITPQAPEYREALIELGNLYYLQKKYFEAIGRLDEAVSRFGDSEQGPVLRYKLADAYRQSVEIIERELQNSMPQKKRDLRLAQRAEHLEKAQILFNGVINQLQARHPQPLSELETLYLRNSYLYQADCAFDLGRYEDAIALYDKAAKQLEKHPASLVALVQIVNAQCELGQPDKARIANEQAMFALKHIPDEAFNEPGLPMKREHWENWLRWSNEYDLFDKQKTASAN